MQTEEEVKRLMVELRTLADVYETQDDPASDLLKQASITIFHLWFDLREQIRQNEILSRKLDGLTWNK